MRWIKLYNSQFSNAVVVNRVKKAHETLKKFVMDGEISSFANKQISAIVKGLYRLDGETEMDDYRRDDKDVVKSSILAAENQGNHISLIGQVAGKRVEKVGSVFPSGAEVTRDTTRGDLEQGALRKQRI